MWACQVPGHIWQTPTWHWSLSARASCQVGCWWLLSIWSGQTMPSQATPQPALSRPACSDCCWPRLAVDVAGRINRKYRAAAGMKVAQLQQSASSHQVAAAAKPLRLWWWGVRVVINKPQSIPPVLSIVSSYDWGLYWIIFVVMIYKCILPADTTQNKVSWLFFERS